MERIAGHMASNLASELSGTQMVEFVARLGRAGVSLEVAKKLMGDDGAMREFVSNGREGIDLITVSEFSADELIKKLPVHVDRNFAKYDFLRDECGKTYEFQVWKPDHDVVPATMVREHFTDGFHGNTPAFLAWIIKYKPNGDYVSIPPDERLFRRDDGHLCPPKLSLFGIHGTLKLDQDVWIRSRGEWSFVAFREFKST